MINNGTRPAIVQNKEEEHKIQCSFAAGSTVYIYPDKLRVKKRIYNENLKCCQTLITGVDISEIPENEREYVKNLQIKLNHAIKDLKAGKIQRINEGLI